MTRAVATLFVALLAGVALAGCAETAEPPAGAPPVATPPAPTFDASDEAPRECTSRANPERRSAAPVVVFETTKGAIRLRLFCDKTPITSQNMVDLVESRYYDGTRFHRVIRDFMNQGGDPYTRAAETPQTRWGTGGPGYTIVDEFACADGTISNTHPATCQGGLALKHDRPGILSMANRGQARTGGSQFFLTAVATPHLDGKHAVFGEAADAASLEVILAINRAPTGVGDRPAPDIFLTKATVEWG